MQVLSIHSHYLSAVSGENRVVAEEVDLLRRGGHDALLYSPSVDTDTNRARWAADTVWSRSAVDAVRELVKHHRPDVIHIHALYPRLSPAPIRAAAELGVPVVATLHNFRLLCLPATLLRDGRICEDCLGRLPWPGVVHGCYRRSRPASAAMAASLALHRARGTFDRVALFLAVSEFVKRKHVEAGFHPDRIVVKPNFATAQVRRRDPGGAFLVLGRLSTEKGIDTLLRSWDGLTLDVVGEGPERERLIELAPSSVSFHEPLPPTAVPELLARARALLVPSRCYEGQPRVVLEAFAAGVPVLASRIGGLPELVEHAVNGLLVDVDDERGWREATERLMDDDESERLGEGAFRTWQKRFTPELALKNLEDAYSTAIAEKHGSLPASRRGNGSGDRPRERRPEG
jgi:glycosyltransferase involved in cell wall biosynthesis